jgi:hypothetical protein
MYVCEVACLKALKYIERLKPQALLGVCFFTKILLENLQSSDRSLV